MTQLGLLYHRQGNYGAAQIAYERSLALDQPNERYAYTSRIASVVGAGNETESLAIGAPFVEHKRK